jgi:hypothetical protein
MTKIGNVKPALLTRNEIQWLQGELQVSKSYQRKIKSDIRRKLSIFQGFELPILIRSGFVDDVISTANCNATTSNCNIGNAGNSKNTENPAQKKPWPGFGPGTFALPRQRSTRLSYQGTFVRYEQQTRVSLSYLSSCNI